MAKITNHTKITVGALDALSGALTIATLKMQGDEITADERGAALRLFDALEAKYPDRAQTFASIKEQL